MDYPKFYSESPKISENRHLIHNDMRLKLFDKIYNKRLIKHHNKEKESGNAVDKVIVKAKDNNVYIIEHFKYSDDYEVLSKGANAILLTTE